MSLTTRLARAAAASKTRGLPAWSRVSGVVVANNNVAVASTTTSRTMFSATNPVAAAAAAGGPQVKELAAANPYKDVVRYEHKNRKWNLQHVDFYSEALAIGLLETGLKPGDVVLSWLPGHLSESMVLQFACSKSGLILYNLDPMLATENPEAAKEALAQALTVTKANVLITQEAGSDVNYVRLCESVIPEVRLFDFAEGKPFVTPRFPHLRFPIHTGFDQDDKWGMLLLKHFVVPADNLDELLPSGFTVSGSTPLLGELILDAKGIPTGTGKIKTNDEVLKSGVWDTFSKILKREYHEVQGVGVVW